MPYLNLRAVASSFYGFYGPKSKMAPLKANLGTLKIFFQTLGQKFKKCRDFLDCWDLLFANVEIETLDWDTIETNWDPQA